MAKITSLAELTDVASDDLLVVVDKSDTSMADSGTDKKVQKSNLIKDTVPAGVIEMFGGSTAPSGYLICDGSAVSRTTYSKLFTAIGTTYGAGDGSTTFNVPNLKGRVAVGYNSAETEFNALGKTGGEKTHTLTIAEMPSHSHNYNLPNPSAPNYMTGGGAYNVRIVDFTSTATTNTGGGNAHNNLQPYIAINYIIKT